MDSVKYNVLKAINLTKEEALEYISGLENANEQTAGESRVTTPCEVVYLSKDGKIEVLPYLDLSRVTEVWGAKCGNTLFKKAHDQPTTWKGITDVYKMVRVKGHTLALPALKELQNLYSERADFNQTMDIFRRNGVFAENLKDSWYWAADLQQEHSAYMVNLESGYESVFVSFSTTGTIRPTLVVA